MSELLQVIKAELNRPHDKGRWLLTGSASFWAMPRGTQALTGRIQLLEVMLFSQGELDGVHEDFFDLALGDRSAGSERTAARNRSASAISSVRTASEPMSVNGAGMNPS